MRGNRPATILRPTGAILLSDETAYIGPVRVEDHGPMNTTLIVIIVLVVLIGMVVMTYNGLVTLRQNTNQAFADIDVQLKQRHDLIPNLVETVKGYATHERGTLEAVIAARNSAMSATGVQNTAAAEGVLGAALGKLIALSEAYPDLKANTNFQQLQAELSDIENKLAAARRFFNNAVGEYNGGVQRFPAVLFAGMMGFAPREFFDVGGDRATLNVAPEVKF
jgi:LemA protein